MELDRYVTGLRDQLLAAAQSKDDDAMLVAERLIGSLESSVRLTLLEALSDAANEITLELAPGSVEVRLRGRDPELVVTPPPPAPSPMTSSDATAAADGEEGTAARVTLRLPEAVKQRMEAAAARQSLSVNTWLVRTVAAAVDAQPGPDS